MKIRVAIGQAFGVFHKTSFQLIVQSRSARTREPLTADLEPEFLHAPVDDVLIGAHRNVQSIGLDGFDRQGLGE